MDEKKDRASTVEKTIRPRGKASRGATPSSTSSPKPAGPIGPSESLSASGEQTTSSSAAMEGSTAPIVGRGESVQNPNMATSEGRVGDLQASFELGVDGPQPKPASSSGAPVGLSVEQSPKSSAAEYTSARLAEDSPSTRDELGFVDYARAIARFLTHPDSKPPLTISIQAPWGGGKTSLMLMIEEALDPGKKVFGKKSDPAPTKEKTNLSSESSGAFAHVWRALLLWVGRGIELPPLSDRQRLSVGEIESELHERLATGKEPALPSIPEYTDDANHRVTVWFNAWKYESTNQVWAGLVDAILQQVPVRLSPRERELFWFRLNVSRVGSDRVRQRLYERAIDLTLRTSVGLVRAALAAALCGVIVLFFYLFPWSSDALKSLFGWTVPVSVIGAFTVVKTISAKMKLDAEPVAEVVKNLVDVPKYEQELGFVHQVERDLKRVFASLPRNEGLVIFIDDLDRCSPLKVAAVLEAVNLFLAGDFDDCCFVVGMDTEMVAAALQAAHKDLTANLPGDERTPLGWRFMDKFVQLPFVIPPVADEQYQHLMMMLLRQRDDVTAVSPSAKTDRHPGDADEQRAFDDDAERLHALRSDTEEFVALTREASKVLGGTPRELKRFVNLLRFNYFLRFSRLRKGLVVPPPATLGRWTALSVKWPEHVRWLRRVRDRTIPEYKVSEWFPDRKELAAWCRKPNHLALLERVAVTCLPQDDDSIGDKVSFGINEWAQKLEKIYQLDRNKSTWITDESLLEFYFDSASENGEDLRSLAKYWDTGFW